MKRVAAKISFSVIGLLSCAAAGPAARSGARTGRSGNQRRRPKAVLDPRKETPHSPRLGDHSVRIRRGWTGSVWGGGQLGTSAVGRWWTRQQTFSRAGAVGGIDAWLTTVAIVSASGLRAGVSPKHVRRCRWGWRRRCVCRAGRWLGGTATLCSVSSPARCGRSSPRWNGPVAIPSPSTGSGTSWSSAGRPRRVGAGGVRAGNGAAPSFPASSGTRFIVRRPAFSGCNRSSAAPCHRPNRDISRRIHHPPVALPGGAAPHDRRRARYPPQKQHHHRNERPSHQRER